MKNNFIISTTNNIEGCPIKKYIDAICSNIVIGTNIFSDFAASFTDFFGGRSNSYKRKLEIIYNEASKELKEKALNIGANAIIGFRVDFDEISGKEKSMFMVSVSGTACIIDYKETSSTAIVTSSIIAQTELDKEIQRRSIISKINKGESIQQHWIEFLLENPQIEIIDNLLGRYIKYINEYYDSYKEIISFIERYITLLPKDILVEKAYIRYEADNQAIKTLITNCNLFDPKKILLICQTNFHLAINLLLTNKDFYQKSDIEIMNKIYTQLISLPNTGKIETIKGGLLGKEQEKFICQNGHKSSLTSEYCENLNCRINMKGLTENEVSIIKQFKQRIDVLNDMIDN